MPSELVKTLTQGEILFAKDEVIHDFFLIKEGELGLFYEKENHLVPFQKMSAKEYIGESSLFSNSSWPWTAIVLSPHFQYVSFAKTDVENALNLCPNWVEELTKVLCERLSDTEEILREHRIEDEYSAKKFELTSKFENLFWRKLTEYRQAKK